MRIFSRHRSNAVSKVIVDMREFRSELPSILHKRGIQVRKL
jgi:ERCC4-type nuclease